MCFCVLYLTSPVFQYFYLFASLSIIPASFSKYFPPITAALKCKEASIIEQHGPRQTQRDAPTPYTQIRQHLQTEKRRTHTHINNKMKGDIF